MKIYISEYENNIIKECCFKYNQEKNYLAILMDVSIEMIDFEDDKIIFYEIGIVPDKNEYLFEIRQDLLDNAINNLGKKIITNLDKFDDDFKRIFSSTLREIKLNRLITDKMS